MGTITILYDGIGGAWSVASDFSVEFGHAKKKNRTARLLLRTESQARHFW